MRPGADLGSICWVAFGTTRDRFWVAFPLDFSIESAFGLAVDVVRDTTTIIIIVIAIIIVITVDVVIIIIIIIIITIIIVIVIISVITIAIIIVIIISSSIIADIRHPQPREKLGHKSY